MTNTYNNNTDNNDALDASTSSASSSHNDTMYNSIGDDRYYDESDLPDTNHTNSKQLYVTLSQNTKQLILDDGKQKYIYDENSWTYYHSQQFINSEPFFHELVNEKSYTYYCFPYKIYPIDANMKTQDDNFEQFILFKYKTKYLSINVSDSSYQWCYYLMSKFFSSFNYDDNEY